MKTRRDVLKGIAAVPLVAFGIPSLATAGERLDPASPSAQALQYTEESETQGQTCANCLLFNQDSEACAVFPGVTVEPNGWCSAWVASA